MATKLTARQTKQLNGMYEDSIVSAFCEDLNFTSPEQIEQAKQHLIAKIQSFTAPDWWWEKD